MDGRHRVSVDEGEFEQVLREHDLKDSCRPGWNTIINLTVRQMVGRSKRQRGTLEKHRVSLDIHFETQNSNNIAGLLARNDPFINKTSNLIMSSHVYDKRRPVKLHAFNNMASDHQAQERTCLTVTLMPTSYLGRGDMHRRIDASTRTQAHYTSSSQGPSIHPSRSRTMTSSRESDRRDARQTRPTTERHKSNVDVQVRSARSPVSINPCVHPYRFFFNSSICSVIPLNSLIRASSPSRRRARCSCFSFLNSSSSCSCQGYRTPTWNASAELAMMKLVREKPRVISILLCCSVAFCLCSVCMYVCLFVQGSSVPCRECSERVVLLTVSHMPEREVHTNTNLDNSLA